MERVFVFGSQGNVAAALGQGWSVEEAFAWTIGLASTLALPTTGDTRAYTLRLDLHPAIFPGAIDRQSLTIRLDGKALAHFELSERRVIVVPLPVERTVGHRQIRLTLEHPDAARPADHGGSDDTRVLGFCFHSATLALTRAGETASAHAESPSGLEPVHGLIGGGALANVLTEIIGKLPSLRGCVGLRVIDFATPLDERIATLPPATLDTASFCWIDNRAGTANDRDGLRARLPEGCATFTFLTPHLRALWPFLTIDPRARPEPGRYADARYPQGDRIAMQFANANIPDDVVWLMYEAAAEQEPVDLDAALDEELRHMIRDEAAADIRMADYIRAHLGTSRLFLTPYLPNVPLIREIAARLLDIPPLRDVVRGDVLREELDALLEGFVPWDVELPVHPRVARHFGLNWWTPEMTYRWFNNYRTRRQYTLDYIRWVPWRI